MISNLLDYIKEIERLLSKFKTDTKVRIYYRGEPGTFLTPMVPSVFRDKQIDAEKNHYLRAIRHHPEDFSSSSNIDVISKLQHYRYPTRMLDFTVNSLVALFFSCAGDTKAEGTYKDNGNGHVYIYIADHKRDVLNFNSDRALLLSVLPLFSQNEQNELRKIFEDARSENVKVTNQWIKEYAEKGNNIETFGRFMHQIRIERPGFEYHHIVPSDMLKGYFVKPNFTTSRIKNQAGLFTIFGLGDKDFKSAFTVRENYNYYDIEIDKNQFDEILAELDYYCNLGFSTMFDDLESTAKAHKYDLYEVWRKNHGN